MRLHSAINYPLQVRHFPCIDYELAWRAMSAFTDARTADTPDEVWFLQHPPVFTQGQAGKPEHVLFAGDIPVVQTDRGGQVTYHGPGQLVVYPLIELARYQLNVRQFVELFEQIIIETLAVFDIPAESRREAPGVYVAAGKIASLGFRIRKGYSYHGISLNIDMNLAPFQQINPCGFAGLAMVDMASQWVQTEPLSFARVMDVFQTVLLAKLSTTPVVIESAGATLLQRYAQGDIA